MATKSPRDNPHAKHRERVRDEFFKNGFDDSIPDHRLLEFLLFYARPRCDTNELAHELLEHFGSFSELLEADIYDLMSVKGVGKSTALFLKLLLPVYRRYETGKKEIGTNLSTFTGICEYVRNQYVGQTKETVSLLSLSSSGKLLGFDIVSEGDVAQVCASTRKFLMLAMRRHATCCVLAHNHPNGLALPSKADIDATVNLKASLNEIGVELLDHIIIVDYEYTSLRISNNYKHIFEKKVLE